MTKTAKKQISNTKNNSERNERIYTMERYTMLTGQKMPKNISWKKYMDGK